MQEGQTVTVVKGPIELVGESGQVVRKDEVCNFWFITLDKHSDNPKYRHIEFGPFSESELEAI